jgi:hypothetical protein
MTRKLSDQIVVSFPFTETDIGGTNSAGGDDAVHWVDMQEFNTFLCLVELGTWNSTDDLDTCKLEQATSSAGAGKKDLTTSASGGNYNTDNPVDADGDQVILECQADDLDVDGGFRYVRVYLAETGNTGVDNVSAVYVRAKARNAYSNLLVAPSTGSKVYVSKNT